MATQHSPATAPQDRPPEVPQSAPQPEAAGDPTRDRLMTAAMELVARKGIRGTTVRDLAQAAGTNLAAVNYHYGSKLALMNEAIIRIVLPVNQRRLAMLAATLRDPDSGAMALRDILECLFRPVVESPVSADGSRLYLRVLHHYRAEASAQANALIRDTFDEAGQRFVDEFALALPHLTRAEIIWRYELARGGILHILSVGAPSLLARRGLDHGAPLMRMDQVEAIMELFLRCYLPMFERSRVWSEDQLQASP